jgi:hypothetical protein
MNTRKLCCFILYLSAFAVIFSCVRDRTSNTDTVDFNGNGDSSNYLTDKVLSPMLWIYDAVGDSMVKNEIPENISLELVLDTLNKRYGNSKLQMEKIAGDTLYVKIDDVSYLEKYGSTGNYQFMAEIVYSLTEVPGINYVFLNFDEVDHAAPGLYNREKFDNKIVE